MGLIDDYEKLVSSIRSLAGEIPDFKDQIALSQRAIDRAKTQKNVFELERNQRSDSLIRQRLAELTDAEYNRISTAQASIDQQIAAITSRYNSDIEHVSEELYTDKLSKQYALLEKMNSILQTYSLPKDIPSELTAVVTDTISSENIKYTDKQLLDLMNDVVELSEDLGDNLLGSNNTILDKFLEFISFSKVQSSNYSNSTKFYLYLVYLAGLIFLTATIPIVPVVALSTAAYGAYKKYSQENKALLDFILPYSKLQNGKNYLTNKISDKQNKYRTADLAELSNRYNSSIKPLTDQRAELQLEFENTPQKIRASISNEELKRSVDEQYALKIAECEQTIQKATKTIERQNKFIESNTRRLPALKEKQKDMLRQISESYLNPKGAGTSKYLTKSFFLGINDQHGSLIEFRYDGMSTIIVYKGNTCRVNKDLISMMLMQLLSSMSMNMLDIYLSDLTSAGTDYAVFFREKLGERMHLCSTDDMVKDAISTLHDTLILRTQEILTEAESLEMYNDRMIKNKSLPREYVFFFLQDPTQSQIEDQKLQQLLYNGPTVGIIPIIFINHLDVNHMPSLTKETAPKYMAFFKAFETKAFIFDGATSDLTQSNKLVSDILNNIQKGIR